MKSNILKKKPLNKGFTLFELLIVIVIFLILAGIAYAGIPSIREKAKDARIKADLHKIRNNLDIYYSFANEYPEELPDCDQPLMYEDRKILNAVPCNPSTDEPYFYQKKKSNLHSYRLYTNLSNDQDFSINDVGCAGGCGPDCEFNYGVSSTNVGLTRCSYVCAPGGGQEGTCELFENAGASDCSIMYNKDSTCANGCGDVDNRCGNASGKQVPD